MSGFISGLILAAGTSSRLGHQPKQLLPWRETTLLGWVIRQVEDSPLDEVVVVLGHEEGEIRHHLAPMRAKCVAAADFHQGCTASIRAGLEAIDPQAEAVILILGDQPGLVPETITAVIEAWRRLQTPVVRPSYGGLAGHPMLFTRPLFGHLKALHGDKGVWKLLEANPAWVGALELDRPFPGNVNTWEDYARLRADAVGAGLKPAPTDPKPCPGNTSSSPLVGEEPGGG